VKGREDTTANPRETRRLLIIFNPAAGRHRRERLGRVLDHLERSQSSFEVVETTAAGDAERIAAAADPGRVDVVVAAGGDGTVNEVVNGLAAGEAAGHGLPLALIPLGTANVLAAEIGQALAPAAIARTLDAGKARRIALGRANGRRFILMAGAGFDAHVVNEVSVPLKRRLGKGAYVLATLDQLRRFRYRPYRVRINGSTVDAASVLVANGRYYAGRYLCAPAASLTTPSLEICLFERGGRLSTIGYTLALLTGRLPSLGSFRMISAASVEIEGVEGEPVQGDGDVLTRLHVAIDVIPNALGLLFPPDGART
jgi:diacylglycerol kinase (ATP)